MTHELLAGYPVVIEQAVVWGDMDSYRHVNNTVYFRYFENARLEYFQRVDWATLEKETGVGPILASTSARFRKALAYPDTIWIGAKIVSVLDDRVVMQHRLVSRKLNAVATEGEGTIVAYHHGRGEKALLPDELKRRIAQLEGA